MAGINPTGGFSFGGGQPATGFNFGAAAGAQGQQQQQQQQQLQQQQQQQQPAGVGFRFGTPGSGPGLNVPKTTPGFSFGTPASQTTGFALGTAAPTAATSAATTALSSGFSFGAMTSQPASTGFSFGQTSAAPSSGFGAASTGSFSFGTATTTATTASAGLFATPTGGLALGIGGSATTSQPAPSLVPASSTAVSFAAKPATTAVSSAATSTSAPTAGFSFGGAGGVANTASTLSQSGFQLGGTTTTSTTTGGGFALGGGAGLKLPTSTLTATTSTASSGLASLLSTSISAASSTASAAGGTGATGTGKAMSYRQLEEAINKWTAELEEQEKMFLQQATQVNAWDRLILDNGEKIVQLNKEVERVKMDQQKLDHELDFIHSQQRELAELLEPLEKALDQLPPISYQQHADVEREHTYQLAESIDAQLKTMGKDLKEIIDRLNASNAQQDPNDPVQQITKILNAHMDSLLWIDRHTSSLNRQVEDIGKQMESQRHQQERNFRLAYS